MQFRKGLFAAFCCSGVLTTACTLVMRVIPLPGSLGVLPFAVWAPLWVGWGSAATWGLLMLGAVQAGCLVTGCVGLWKNSRRLAAAAILAYGSDWLCAAVLLFDSASLDQQTAIFWGAQAVVYLLSDGLYLLFLLLAVCMGRRTETLPEDIPIK